MNKLRIFALVLAMMPAIVSAQSWKSETMMTIGDKQITAGEFMEIYEKNNVNGEVLDKKSVDEYLDLFTTFKLKVIEAQSRGMDTAAKFVKELNGYRKQLAKPYFSNDETTEYLVEEAYERMKWDINASHILVKCDEHAVPADTLKAYNKAMKIRERILKGEDFNDVAVEVSDDPSARDHKEIPGKQRAYKGNRGNLGYFTAFDMVYPFETGAYNTKEGEISMPVRSSFGYHIIKVNSKTPAYGTIKAAHIFLAVDENDPIKTDSIVREKINNIYKEIDEDGKNWYVMVNKYTEDRGTVANNGMLSPFRVSQIVPEFIAALKGLKENEIAEPIKTSYGYHIVKLVSSSGIDSFDKEKENIKKRVEKDMRANIGDDVVLKRLMKENKFNEFVKVKDKFIKTVDSTLNNGAFVASPAIDVNSVLFKLNEDSFTINDFIGYIEKNQKQEPFLSPEAYAYTLYDEFVKETVFAYEDSRLETKYPEFGFLVQEYHDGILLFDLMENEVWNKAAKDTAGLKNYYEEHKDEYTWGERVKTMVIITAKPELVDTLNYFLDEELTADSIKAIVKSDRNFSGTSVKTVYFQRGENKDIDAVEWYPSTVVQFNSYTDNMIYIYKMLEVHEAEVKKFKEVRGIVTSAYQTQLEQDWMETLKEKYPVSVNEVVLDEVRQYYEK
ncbi:MAG: peptidylprolyl isomerase [Bacteroidales bacterium]|nr:peptidylprolyl isomerase [Bacteroidales bacterium]